MGGVENICKEIQRSFVKGYLKKKSEKHYHGETLPGKKVEGGERLFKILGSKDQVLTRLPNSSVLLQ